MKFFKLFTIALTLVLVPQFSEAKREVYIPKVKVESALNSELLLQGQPHTAYLKVSLTGFELQQEDRIPVNVALVLDKSGSMSGGKIAKAKEAAIEALNYLRSDDIISIITYDSTVNVVVPATKLTDREAIIHAIDNIRANGNTALFAGVSKGAAEVRKFFSKTRYNHIILLSDGLANRGPSSPAELASLGASLYKEGIGVSTLGLGLGYNEDLMIQLARTSDGNHYFAEDEDDLAYVFDRAFGGATAVVAQDVEVHIRCANGIRPIRILGREAMIDGQNITVSMNQIYSHHEKYVLLEVEVAPQESTKSLKIATVQVDYLNMNSKQKDQINLDQFVGFTTSKTAFEKSENSKVMVSVVEQIGAERNQYAMELRDKGQIKEAEQVLFGNSLYLKDNAFRYKSEKLDTYAIQNEDDAKNLEGPNYKRKRKEMIQRQNSQQMQNF